MTYSILTPYIIPEWKRKAVNAGDGFIFDSVEKLIGHESVCKFSSWAPLTERDIELINQSSMLIVAGANTLRDNFTLCPDFDVGVLEKLQVPVALCGLGHYGHAAATIGMEAASVRLLEAILERFPYISVRCDESKRYVVESAPKLQESVIMTSCPVAFSVDGQRGNFERKVQFNKIVVTVTDRERINQQKVILPAVREMFDAEAFVLALHQDYNNTQLWDFAAGHGYRIFRSTGYQDYIDLYKQSDLHIGNRLHAHLKCLSLGKPSFLLPFDLRQSYFAQSLGFPLVNHLPHQAFDDWDFSMPVERIAAAFESMNVFIAEVRKVLGGGHG